MPRPRPRPVTKLAEKLEMGVNKLAIHRAAKAPTTATMATRNGIPAESSAPKTMSSSRAVRGTENISAVDRSLSTWRLITVLTTSTPVDRTTAPFTGTAATARTDSDSAARCASEIPLRGRTMTTPVR